MRMRWFENMMQPLRRLEGYRELTREKHSWHEADRPGMRKTVWLRRDEIGPDDTRTGLYLPSRRKNRERMRRLQERTSDDRDGSAPLPAT